MSINKGQIWHNPRIFCLDFAFWMHTLKNINNCLWLITNEASILTLRQANTFGKRTSPLEFFDGFITDGYSKYRFVHLLWTVIRNAYFGHFLIVAYRSFEMTRPDILNTHNAANNQHYKPYKFPYSSRVATQHESKPWSYTMKVFWYKW